MVVLSQDLEASQDQTPCGCELQVEQSVTGACLPSPGVSGLCPGTAQQLGFLPGHLLSQVTKGPTQTDSNSRASYFPVLCEVIG